MTSDVSIFSRFVNFPNCPSRNLTANGRAKTREFSWRLQPLGLLCHFMATPKYSMPCLVVVSG